MTKETAKELMLVLGLGLLTYGLWWVYPPAALIAIGIILFVGGLL